jgi:hypothetical protein
MVKENVARITAMLVFWAYRLREKSGSDDTTRLYIR